MDGPIEYEVVKEQTGDWLPGRGWYVVASSNRGEYVAYTGPLDVEQAEQDARRIAQALTETFG